MNHSSRGPIRDLYLGARDHRTLRIGNNAHNAARTNGLSQQQRRGEQEGDCGEQRESRSHTIEGIEIQDREPRSRNIHRTFPKSANSIHEADSWIVDQYFDRIPEDIKPAIFPRLRHRRRLHWPLITDH